MLGPKRIRFVGGPWHNLIPVVEFPVTNLFTADYLERYVLCEFRTRWDTVYYQYVHSSLITGRHIHRRACMERLPVWRIDRRQLDSRIRRAAWKSVNAAGEQNHPIG